MPVVESSVATVSYKCSYCGSESFYKNHAENCSNRCERKLQCEKKGHPRTEYSFDTDLGTLEVVSRCSCGLKCAVEGGEVAYDSEEGQEALAVLFDKLKGNRFRKKKVTMFILIKYKLFITGMPGHSTPSEARVVQKLEEAVGWVYLGNTEIFRWDGSRSKPLTKKQAAEFKALQKVYDKERKCINT